MLSMIAAAGTNGALGKDNQLLWHLPADLAWFKQTTLGKPVVMGRKTYDSVGRPLPKRRNVVISRNAGLRIIGVEVCHSLDAALILLRDEPEVMIVGGAEIYRMALPLAHRIYLTVVEIAPEADAFFPELPLAEWRLAEEQVMEPDARNALRMRFQTWLRRSE